MEPIMFWLILLILLIGVEVATTSLTTIWFAGGSLLAILAAALGAHLGIQVCLFVVASVLMLFFTRPVAVKYFNKDRIRTNAESFVGRQAVVISEIDNIQSIGQVTVSGQEWSARSVDEKGKIPVGAIVRVMAINGVKLIVGEIPNEEQTASVSSDATVKKMDTGTQDQEAGVLEVAEPTLGAVEAESTIRRVEAESTVEAATDDAAAEPTVDEAASLEESSQ